MDGPSNFSARFASPEGRPLGGIFFLSQARRTTLVPLGAAEAATRLFACSFPPPCDGPSLRRVLGTCAHVAATTPCAVLHFQPDASAVRTVMAALAP